MWESAKQFFAGWASWLVFWISVLTTLLALALFVAGYGSPWMWLAFGAVSVAIYSVIRFHRLRQELERSSSRDAAYSQVVNAAGLLTGLLRTRVSEGMAKRGETPPATNSPWCCA
jgi:hypothetical protein